MPLTDTLRRTTRLTGQIMLTVLPAGGQRTARSNAWAGMSTNATRSRSRREADAAMALNAAQAIPPASSGDRQLASVQA